MRGRIASSQTPRNDGDCRDCFVEGRLAMTEIAEIASSLAPRNDLQN